MIDNSELRLVIRATPRRGWGDMNNHRIPSDIDLMWSTLQALVKSGGTASTQEIRKSIVEIMAIPDEILAIPQGEGPRSKIDYRARWARTELKRIGAVVNSKRGFWSITDRGRRFDAEEQLIGRLKEQNKRERDEKKPEEEKTPKPSATDDPETYSVRSVLNEGCFLERQEIERLLERLRTRKNLILQGPPGTGKTWLARRLAFALIGERDERKVRVVQFHPNLSYEDFVRGWRPVGDGKLALADGVFMETLRDASADPSAKFVVVIEEINRGNPAQIFGELLTLLEADKRSPRDAVELCYPDPDGTRRSVHVPENVYVIGTMNIADRSLALVDLALRRRFAFVTLESSLGAAWSNWVVQECGIDPGLVDELRRRIGTLNNRIAVDNRLGSQFQVGHSYVTPTYRLESGATRDWFRQVVETEIGPLLEEY
ncbi:MAG: AAA family ATPase [Chromatiales bacterium]|nr:AAA family ATPase [Chromatiales bacterium]